MLPLADSKSLHKFPFWVFTILLINIYVFYLELTSPNIELLISRYALIPSNINFYDMTTLVPFISSQFLHGGFLHIISNMLFLWVFGRNVEAKLGFTIFPALYLFSGVAGGVVQFLMTPFLNIPMLGASGAIAGVLGAYFTYFPNHKIKTLVFIFIFVTIIEIPAWIMLFYWFVTQVINTSFTTSSMLNQGGVAYTAHIAGFITGLIASRVFHPKTSIVLHRFG